MSDECDSKGLAPIVLFAYARPDHLQRTLYSLRCNDEAARTDLYVFCDGAKGAEHRASVELVRSLVSSIDGFASVRADFRDRNLGLSASIIAGVTAVLARHGRAIVVEDDLIVSPHFLRFMNDGLSLYADEPRVASIHGYCYPTGCALPETFFLRGADCWGWATWSRAWAHFDADGSRLLARLRQRGLQREFDLDGAYPYMKMLADQTDGRNDSWAVRWHAACYLDNLLTLYPGRSLVHNIGNDGSGTHSGRTDMYALKVAHVPIQVVRQPLEPSIVAREAFAHFLRRERGGLARRAARALRDRLVRWT
jgi:hypothetical protein